MDNPFNVPNAAPAAGSSSPTPRIASIPLSLGGGQYNLGSNPFDVVKSPRAYGGTTAQPGYERDHIFPLSLGGTSNKENISMQPADLAAYKDKVENYVASEVRAGRIAPRAGATMVLNWKDTDIPGQQAYNKNFGQDQNVFSNTLKGLPRAALDVGKFLYEKLVPNTTKERLSSIGQVFSTGASPESVSRLVRSFKDQFTQSQDVIDQEKADYSQKMIAAGHAPGSFFPLSQTQQTQQTNFALSFMGENEPFAKEVGAEVNAAIEHGLSGHTLETFANDVKAKALEISKILKGLAKESDSAAVSETLQSKLKFPQDTADAVAPLIAETQNVEHIKNILDASTPGAETTSAALQAEEKQNLIDLHTGESNLPDTSNNQYVKDEPINITRGANDKSTSSLIRSEYLGARDKQILRGNNLAADLKAAVPEEVDRQGMFWYKAAEGNKQTLRDVIQELDHAEEINRVDPGFENVAAHDEQEAAKLEASLRFAPYREQIEKALNLSSEALSALEKGNQFYKEAGDVATVRGTLRDLEGNYQNRVYKPLPPQDFVASASKSGLKQTTTHALHRVFPTEFDAIRGGRDFATTDYVDNLSLYNADMAHVNAARNVADTMASEGVGLGSWSKYGQVPDGWKQVGDLRKNTPIRDSTSGEPVLGEDGNQLVTHQTFVAPKGIAEGLKAITDPDYLKMIDEVRGLQKYQGFLKTIDLAASFYHHLTFVTQTLSSTKGLGTLLDLRKVNKLIEAPDFRALEEDFIGHNGVTTRVSANQDIMNNLSQGDDAISRLLKTPVGKQIENALHAGSEFLFDKMQRFNKVMTYGKDVANWVGSHPLATNEETLAAKRSIAKATNATFGGINWENMGVTKSTKSILRTLLLAPDWFVSSVVLQPKYALEKSPAGNIARATIFKAIVGGILVTEGVNKLLTGHYTDQNPKGHKLEVQLVPNVYTSLIRGGPGEIVKLLSNIQESGLQGLSRYVEGKGSSVTSAATEFLSGVDYTGRSIYNGKNPVQKSFSGLLHLLSTVTPVPFGVSSGAQYVTGGSPSLPGAAAVFSGLGRYSVPPKIKASTGSANPLSGASHKSKGSNPFSR